MKAAERMPFNNIDLFLLNHVEGSIGAYLDEEQDEDAPSVGSTAVNVSEANASLPYSKAFGLALLSSSQ